MTDFPACPRASGMQYTNCPPRAYHITRLTPRPHGRGVFFGFKKLSPLDVTEHSLPDHHVGKDDQDDARQGEAQQDERAELIAIVDAIADQVSGIDTRKLTSGLVGSATSDRLCGWVWVNTDVHALLLCDQEVNARQRHPEHEPGCGRCDRRLRVRRGLRQRALSRVSATSGLP